MDRILVYPGNIPLDTDILNTNRNSMVALGYLAQAITLNEQGVKLPSKKKTAKKPLETPPELLAAFRRNKAARLGFEGLSPSHQREYIEWIIEAKQEATRERRLAQAPEQLAEGKSALP